MLQQGWERPGGARCCPPACPPVSLQPGESEIALPTPLSLQGAGERALSNTESREVCISQIFLMISPHTGQEVKLRSQSKPSAALPLGGSRRAAACRRVRHRAFSQPAWDAVSRAPTPTPTACPPRAAPLPPGLPSARMPSQGGAEGGGTKTRFLTCCHII